MIHPLANRPHEFVVKWLEGKIDELHDAHYGCKPTQTIKPKFKKILELDQREWCEHIKFNGEEWVWKHLSMDSGTTLYYCPICGAKRPKGEPK